MEQRGNKLFRYGRESGEVLLGSGMQRVWRLDTREDDTGRSTFVASGNGRQQHHATKRLSHYMFAGAMRQHEWSVVDDAQNKRRRLAITIMLTLAAAWLIFRWLPLD